MKKYKIPSRCKEIMIMEDIPYALFSTLEKQEGVWVLVHNRVALEESKNDNTRIIYC
jgi:hydrogenase maturation factor